ncbi:MAG: four helix bundle protein [Thermoanaerobaculia bacterium]
MNVGKFEDLIAWQKSRELAVALHRLADADPLSRSRVLADQIRRAGLSIPSNIAEGFERGTPADFHHFLTIAKASCAEVRSHLYLALDLGFVNKEAFDVHQARASEVARIIGGLRAAVGRRKRAKKTQNPSEDP